MTDLDETLDQRGFATALREATWGEHSAAESSPYLKALFGGDLGRDGYARLLVQQWHIYEALEAASDARRGDPDAGPFVFEELRRLPSIEADLAHLVGDGWRDTSEALPATRVYAERIREVGETWPPGLVAHHYTRYMGDLSGGFFIGRSVVRVLGLTPPDGARFFAFDRISDPTTFKDEYRARLDAAPWSADEQAAVIAETLRAYQYNAAVFDDLSTTTDLPPAR